MSTQPTPPPEKAPNHDLEAGNLGLLDSNGGASLRRQISVQLTSEQFERLYLQPGGTKAKGDLAKRFGNPTPLGIASFLLCLTPFSCYLMGWVGTSTAAAATLVGAMYFMGGLGLTLAGIFEWVLGNTFTSVVFITFGAFWLSFGFLLEPSQGIASALDATSVEYNGGIAMYLIWWSVLVLIYLVASLRTNAVFVALFTFLEITFWILSAVYIKSAYGDTSNINALLKAAGAFAFLTTAMGWYLQVVLIFDSVGIPIKLPVGDMSTFMARRRHID
ncbi:acetate uptake transporter family protein [Rhodotorula paludigena]|uniref:acetate uptake transporter family protein n=1 Tax=Rhodotorula paludigena TaxID=86838 RepID=UPI00317DD96C